MKRCEETILKGGAPAACDQPLDERDQCPRASKHVDG